MSDMLEDATLFDLEGLQMTIAQVEYRLDVLIAEETFRGLGEKQAVLFGARVADKTPVSIKLRFQMNPKVIPTESEREGYKRFAREIFEREVQALQATSHLEDTPTLYADDRLVQDRTYLYAGGYIHAIVTERMPGKPILDYSDLTDSEAHYIKGEVMRILEEIKEAGWCVGEGHRHTVFYDRETGKVSLTDLEEVEEASPDGPNEDYSSESAVVKQFGQGIWWDT